MQAAIARGIPVVGDIELFAWAARSGKGARHHRHQRQDHGDRADRAPAARGAASIARSRATSAPPALDALLKRKNAAGRRGCWSSPATSSRPPGRSSRTRRRCSTSPRTTSTATRGWRPTRRPRRASSGRRRAGAQPRRLGLDGAGAAGPHAGDLRARCARDAGGLRRSRGRDGWCAARSASSPLPSCRSRARTTQPTRWPPARSPLPRARRSPRSPRACELPRPAAPHAARRAARRRRVAGRLQGHQRRRHRGRAEWPARSKAVLILGGEGKGQDFAPLARR